MAVAAFAYTKILTSEGSSTPQDNAVVRNQMSDGYPSQFDRFSVDFITYDITYLMSSSEYASFITWWKANKSQFFNFTDPIDAVVRDGRIVEGKFTASPYTAKSSYFSVSMSVERVL